MAYHYVNPPAVIHSPAGKDYSPVVIQHENVLMGENGAMTVILQMAQPLQTPA
jgi:hypothetical protein